MRVHCASVCPALTLLPLRRAHSGDAAGGCLGVQLGCQQLRSQCRGRARPKGRPVLVLAVSIMRATCPAPCPLQHAARGHPGAGIQRASRGGDSQGVRRGRAPSRVRPHGLGASATLYGLCRHWSPASFEPSRRSTQLATVWPPDSRKLCSVAAGLLLTLASNVQFQHPEHATAGLPAGSTRPWWTIVAAPTL